MQFSKLNYFLFLFSAFFYTGAFAQSSIESAREPKSEVQKSYLLMTVKDQFDGTIASAQIGIRKIGSDNKIQIQTDDSGTAKIRSLADGEYQITVTAAGFKEYEGKKIILKSGSVNHLEIVLEIASIESNINVSESESVDSDRSTPAIVLDQNDIKNLPDKQEDFERALRHLASPDPDEELSISVNGLAGAKIPPKQAIQQFRINQNVYSAQFETPSGSGTDILTRAKIDNLSGSIGSNFADSRFDARNPFAGSVIPSRSSEFSLNLTGPLGKKSNFFFNLARTQSDQGTVINASVLDTNLQPAAFRVSFAAPARATNIYLNINSDVTRKHKLFFSGALYNERLKGIGVGDFNLSSRAADTSNGGGNFQFSDTYLKNAGFVTQTAISVFSNTSQSRPMSSAAALEVSEAFSSGGSAQNFNIKNLFFQASNQTTWQLGKYTLGFGGRLRVNSLDQYSRTNYNGSYIFSGRLAPILDASNRPLRDPAGNYLTTQISSLESYRRTLLFRQLGLSNQTVRSLGGGASQFTISGGNPQINLSQYDYAFYVQNSYQFSPTVAVSFGLRYENQNNIKDDSNFAPRAGIIWSPKAQEKRRPFLSLPRISAGFGMFYTRFSLSNTLSVRLSNDPDKVQYLITDPAILDLYPNVPSVNLLSQAALPKNQRYIDNNLKTPAQLFLTAAVTEKLIGGFSLNLAITTSQTYRQNVIRNINAPPNGNFNFSDPQGNIRPSAEAGNIYGVFSNGKAKKTKISAQLQFPNAGKLYSSVSYFLIRSKNNVVSGSGAPFDPDDFGQESAPGTADGIQSISGYSSYQLPHGFSAGGSYTFRTGGRFNIYTGRDTNGDGFFNERPALAIDLSKPVLINTKYGILDPNPGAGEILIPRNFGRGSKYFSVDANISKTINFKRHTAGKKPLQQSLNLTLDIFNLFNVINRSDPIGNMSSPNFLQIIKGAADTDSVPANDGYHGPYGVSVNPNAIGRHFGFGISYKF